VQVTTTVEQVTEGVWQGLALWDTKLPAVAKLASNFGQHTCLRLTLPAKVDPPPLPFPSLSLIRNTLAREVMSR